MGASARLGPCALGVDPLHTVVYPGAMLPYLILLAVLVLGFAVGCRLAGLTSPPIPVPQISEPRKVVSMREGEDFLAAGGKIYTTGLDGVPEQVDSTRLRGDWRGSVYPFWLMPPNTIPARSYLDCALWLQAHHGTEVWVRGFTGYRQTFVTASEFKLENQPFTPFDYFLVDAR